MDLIFYKEMIHKRQNLWDIQKYIKVYCDDSDV